MKNSIKFALLYLLLTTLPNFGASHFLSFIMPCYNCATTVKRSLDSIINQQLSTPYEIICTDDASTDNTLAILREYEKQYKNFHVYVHEKNKGGGAASNTCIYHSQGDIIFRLDSDNVLSDNFIIARLIDLLDQTHCEAASVAEIRFYKDNLVTIGSWCYHAPHNIADLSYCMSKVEDPAHSGNYLYTRKSFNRAGGYHECHGADTFCFGFKQYATGTKIAILPDTFYWHCYNPQGYWAREETTGNNRKMALATLLEFAEVFSTETEKYLKHFDIRTQDFTAAHTRGTFIVANNKILEHIFKGYIYEEDKNYEEAANEFEHALNLGCNNKQKISQKIKKCRSLSVAQK